MFPSAADYSEEEQQDDSILRLRAKRLSKCEAETRLRDLTTNEENLLKQLEPQKYTSIKNEKLFSVFKNATNDVLPALVVSKQHLFI